VRASPSPWEEAGHEDYIRPERAKHAWTANSGPTHVTNMRINHSHGDAMTAEQILNHTHIMTRFEPMGGEAMPKRLKNSQLDCLDCLIKTFLLGRLMEPVTSPLGRGARSSRPWR
jgi:hypothetical protein